MAYQITIKNSVHEKLKELKGEGSFSDAIESMMNKLGIGVPASVPQQTNTIASTNTNSVKERSSWLKEGSGPQEPKPEPKPEPEPHIKIKRRRKDAT